MARKNKTGVKDTGKTVFRFSLPGLFVFTLALLAVGGLLSFSYISRKATAKSIPLPLPPLSDGELADAPPRKAIPAWGEFLTREIELERPVEYLTSELKREQVPNWIFEQMGPEQARALLLSCGLTVAQADRALTANSVAEKNTVLRPDDELVLSLSPQTRAKLYGELAHSPANHYMYFPFSFQGRGFEAAFESSNLDDTVIERIRKLLYPRGDAQCFSDFEVVMRGLPSTQERLWLLKVLSRQRALLVRLRIRSETDIDKLLAYWDHGSHSRDARPLLESLKRLPEGGTLSLLYLLPSFARERLYTYPPPAKPNDPPQDCHWTTLNFFHDPPDDRFANSEYTVQYLKTNCYPVARPECFGDMVFVLNRNGGAIHSAVYLAEDIVFTKNGNDGAQPWMLMRLKDLVGLYSPEPGMRLAVYRLRARQLENPVTQTAANTR